MKRNIKTALACVMAATCLFALVAALSACDIISGLFGGHKHEYTDTVVEATCTEQGYTLRTCACGEEKKEKIVNALGHNYTGEYTVDKNATCTESGSKSFHCTRCGEKNNETEIAALGHSYSSGWTVDEKATCTTAGSQSRKCVRCNAKTDVKPMEALGHDYDERYTTDKKPTCTEAGIETKHCSRCSSTTDPRAITALGHDYATLTTVDKSATCTADGQCSRHCSRCDSKIDIEAIPKLGHNYSDTLTVDRNATCTSDGRRSRHCTRCNASTDIVTIPKLGHNYSNTVTVDKKATCTEDGRESRHCTRCDSTIDEKALPKLGHDIVSQKTVEPACLEEGYTEYTCSRCSGYKDDFVAKTSHSMWKGECKVCGYIDVNYYYEMKCVEEPYKQNSRNPIQGEGGEYIVFELSKSLQESIKNNPNKKLQIVLEFEAMCDRKSWNLSGTTGIHTAKNAGEKYLCEGITKIGLDTKVYTKLSFEISIPAKSIIDGKLYFYYSTPVTWDLTPATFWIKNVYLGASLID